MMISGSFQSHRGQEFYSLHYKIWGEENKKTLVCVAGLLGHSDDFKFVGEALAAKGYRVASLDLAGRGQSDYLLDPTGYNYQQYIIDLNNFLSVIGCTTPKSCDWFGVSLGGLLGIRIAGMVKSPIQRLILSDVGPDVPQFDLDFISKVMKLTPEYDRPEDAIPFLKMSLGTPYSRGPLPDDKWQYLVSTALTLREDGKYIRNFDPNLSIMFDKEPLGEVPLWPLWDKIDCPVLAVRGGLSTLFPVRVAEQMARHKVGAPFDIVTIPDCGHVPSFLVDDHISILSNWLLKAD